jgi:hypothetical protein
MSPLLYAIVLVSFAALAAPASAQTAGARAEVPIRAVVLPDGVRRYSITLTVDGRPIEAQLDTGSTGLRVLQTRVTGTVASARGPSVRYSYGSGVEFGGVKVSAPVGLGGLAGVVPIERVQTVSCTDRKPECPAAALSATDYRIGGNGIAGQGFLAIIGTGLRDDTVPNPLVALGAWRWIVELPRDGEAGGRLILNPSTDEVARYREFALLGDSNQLSACLVRTDNAKRICGPAMVDTGATGLRVLGGKADEMWPRGTAAAIVLGDAGGTASFPVTIGRRDQASGMFAYPRRAGSDVTTLNLGLAPFFHWSVLFDAAGRKIGVVERAKR